MPNVLLVVGHADPHSYTHALADAYAASAHAEGAEVTRIDLASIRFDPVLRLGYRTAQPLEPDLELAKEAMVRAHHVVFFFPMWWAGAPALVKGFIDRVFLPGFAFRYEKGNALPKKLLGGRSARLVTSMDSPAFWYRVGYRRSLHRAFVDGTLAFVGFSPVRETTFYGLRSMNEAKRLRGLAKVAEHARSDVRAAARARGGAGASPRRPQTYSAYSGS